MQIFYAKDINSDGLIILPEDESKHCIKVLRKKIGDQVEVVNGVGGYYKCEIIEDKPKHCKLRIIEKKSEFRKNNFNLTIGIAPTKNLSRFEWFLEKSTEIGIDSIVPIITDRSERKKFNEQRLEKILITAMKQSGRAYLPQLLPLTTFKRFLKSDLQGSKFIATCDAKPLLQKEYSKGMDTVIVIGPEGDFTENEILKAQENGFKAVSLGKSRLRVETAGIVVCHTINLLNE